MLVQILVRYLLHKARRLGPVHLSIHHTAAGKCQHQVILRPRDAHIAQPPLLLERLSVVGIDAHAARKEPLLHPREKYMRKLKSLGSVHRHQRDPRLRFIQRVHLRHERDLLKEIIDIVIFGRLGYQLADILQPGLRLHVAFLRQLLRIARILEQTLYQLLYAHAAGQPLPVIRHELCKCRHPRSRLSRSDRLLCSGTCIKKGYLTGLGVLSEPLRRGRSYTALGYIDDTHARHIIAPVGDGLDICQHILYLPALIEVHAAYQLVGQTEAHAALLQQARLRIGSV